MKKITIKLRITLWFTAFMILLCAVVFVFIAVVSNTRTTQDTRNALTALVERNMREIEYDEGALDIDDDFASYENGVYCLIFSKSGEKVSGSAPYAGLDGEPFEDKRVRQVKVGDTTYLIYDRLIESKRYDDIWVRGVVLESGGALSVSAVSRAVLIALPLLLALAAGGGYLIAGHSLRPIEKISRTAEEIGSSGDLSKRIEMDDGTDELHRLAATFNRMFDRLEANFEAERHFTSDASHEMRTPVSTILAQCEYAFENASGEDELYEAIAKIQKQGWRISHLIESLLYFTRIEQNTETVSLETVDISALTASVCREQLDGISCEIPMQRDTADTAPQKMPAEHTITLTQDIQPDITMKADTLLFAHMLENLIRNAYRYGKEGGNIHVSLKDGDGVITLSVTDDGIGISPDELPKIWNRFYRVDAARSSSQGPGLGLGLAMVKQIVKILGGSVHVKSEAGKGSAFTVQFTKN